VFCNPSYISGNLVNIAFHSSSVILCLILYNVNILGKAALKSSYVLFLCGAKVFNKAAFFTFSVSSDSFSFFNASHLLRASISFSNLASISS